MFLPLSLAAIGPIPRQDVAKATGVFNLTRQLGGSIGVAVLSTVLDHRSAFHRAVLVAHTSVDDKRESSAAKSVRVDALHVAEREQARAESVRQRSILRAQFRGVDAAQRDQARIGAAARALPRVFVQLADSNASPSSVNTVVIAALSSCC
jgi:hypothetical protein